MHKIDLDGWQIWLEVGKLPDTYDAFVKHAKYVDEIDLQNTKGAICFLGISKGSAKPAWPDMIVAQSYAHPGTFDPGFLIVPGTSLIFIGAETRLLCYDVEQRRRLWEDSTDFGFWRWSQAGNYVLMSAELEFGVWNTSGKKLWTTFVEPPWDFEIVGDTVMLDVMGVVQKRRLSDGTTT